MSHTPGPWSIEGDSDLHMDGTHGFVFIGAPPRKSRMGNVALVQRDNPNQAEDARLIAAAPDLLEALERIATRRYEGKAYWAALDGDTMFAIAEAAIAQATGAEVPE